MRRYLHIGLKRQSVSSGAAARTPFVASLMAALLAIGCDRPADPLPDPAPLPSALTDAGGFPIEPRPGCSDAVRAALRAPDPGAITVVATQGGNFTCGDTSGPLPLDEAVLSDVPQRVRLLLESRADPNARWFSHGDRYPLQEAIMCNGAWMRGVPCRHRSEIVRLLLQHGTDPNGRWCLFETRGTDGGRPCTSKLA
jgi:hypothetical protein